jgi:hypothetical protein
VLNCLSSDPKARPNLAQLLPALNRFIKRGPPMWPTDFHPEFKRPYAQTPRRKTRDAHHIK